MSAPLVTVIVPTFNRAYCLERTLRSALGQTHRNIEVVVVDDGSTDRTPLLLARLGREDCRLRTFRQANEGVVAARNTALIHARGEYVAFLDSDDRWFPWKVALQLSCFHRVPELGMVWSDMTAVDAAGAIISASYLRTMYTAYQRISLSELFQSTVNIGSPVPDEEGPPGVAALHVGDIYAQMLFGSLVHTSTVMLTRERLTQVGVFDTEMGRSGEDYDFHLRTCREGTVGFIDVPTIAYRTGLSDRLTAPEFAVTIAEGYLKAVTKAIARDRSRVALSPATLSSIVAKAHVWLGEELLDAHRAREARRHFLRAFRLDAAARPLLRWVRACMPDALAAPLREMYRAGRALPVTHL